VTSLVNNKSGDATTESIREKNSVLLFIFCGQKGFGQMAFTLEIRPVYGDKCFTRPAMFGVRSLLEDEKVLLMKKDLVVVLY